MIKLMTRDILRSVSEQAKQSPRLRKNFNFHGSDDAKCHRLLNALEPGTYVQPHRHLDQEKEESIIVLAGKIGVLIFDENGAVVETIVLAAQSDNFGITIPVGVFHSMVALEPESVFFEAKAGPYAPISEQEKSTWAPAEGVAGYLDFLQHMTAHFASS